MSDLFFFNDPATTEIYTLSLHDALPIYHGQEARRAGLDDGVVDVADDRELRGTRGNRSEEHTSELQSRLHLVCRLLLEKKKNSHPHRERRAGEPVRAVDLGEPENQLVHL